jgi:hypothetical protein
MTLEKLSLTDAGCQKFLGTETYSRRLLASISEPGCAILSEHI